MPAGTFVPPRFGRSSPPLANYLWLVMAILTDCAPLAGAVTWIAVLTATRIWAADQRTHTPGGLVLTTLRISITLADIAGRAVAGPVTALINDRRALVRVVDNLMQFATSGPDWTGHRIPAPQPPKIAAAAENPGFQDQHHR